MTIVSNGFSGRQEEVRRHYFSPSSREYVCLVSCYAQETYDINTDLFFIMY